MLSLCSETCGIGADPWEEERDVASHLSYMRSVETRSGRDSPFLPLDKCEEFKWPSLFAEIDEMLESTVLIEQLSRNKSLSAPRSFPMTHIEIRSLLYKEYKTIPEALPRNASNSKSARYTPTTVIELEKSRDEVVYSVAVNHQRKRVTVCFEGSTNLLDYMLSRPSLMKSQENPVKKFNPGATDYVNIHQVLHSFLFDCSANSARGPTGKILSKYHETLYNHIVPVFRKYPSYKLYFTGHGFGGALATVYGMFAASEPHTLIPAPVTVVSFGSPYIGDIRFRAAHQCLERMGRLRNVRISNHQDMVTITPQITPLATQWFKHVGVNLRLYAGLYPLDISYPRMGSGLIWESIDECSRGWDQSVVTNFPWNTRSALGHHHLDVYKNRLKQNEGELRTISLNDIYVCRQVVGESFLA